MTDVTQADREAAASVAVLLEMRELTAAELAEYERLAKLAHFRRLSAHGGLV